MSSDAQPSSSETAAPSEVKDVQRTARVALSKQGLEVRQSDPNSPLYSAKSFEELELRRELLDGVFKVGYQKPSKIQELAIPNIVKKPDQHFVGQAQAGTGKTAAFALSALARLDVDALESQVLVLCPTRELALQVYDSFKDLAQFLTTVKLLALVKDVALPEKVDHHILVGTPGTIMDLVRRKKIETKKLKMVVIDEADQMITPPTNTKDTMWPQTRAILKTASQAQICLFSATFPAAVLEAVDALLSAPAPGSKEPRHFTKITLAPEEQSLDQIHEFYLVCQPEEKFNGLITLFKAATLGSTVIFVNTKSGANDMHVKLNQQGYEASVLHGDLTPTERDSTMRNFRESKIRVLIVTNMFARGINIPEITTVINYEMPYIYGKPPGTGDAASYLHRIGRSGRFGADGTAISLTSSNEERDALKSINAELCAVYAETGKAKRKREIKKLTMTDISEFTKTIQAIEEAAI